MKILLYDPDNNLLIQNLMQSSFGKDLKICHQVNEVKSHLHPFLPSTIIVNFKDMAFFSKDIFSFSPLSEMLIYYSKEEIPKTHYQKFQLPEQIDELIHYISSKSDLEGATRVLDKTSIFVKPESEEDQKTKMIQVSKDLDLLEDQEPDSLQEIPLTENENHSFDEIKLTDDIFEIQDHDSLVLEANNYNLLDLSSHDIKFDPIPKEETLIPAPKEKISTEDMVLSTLNVSNLEDKIHYLSEELKKKEDYIVKIKSSYISEIETLKSELEKKDQKPNSEFSVNDYSDELKRKIQRELKKIQVRERELENQLELLKADSEIQIQNRDRLIMDLKRKIDMLQFDIENSTEGEQKAKEQYQKLEQKLESVMRKLKGALSDV